MAKAAKRSKGTLPPSLIQHHGWRSVVLQPCQELGSRNSAISNLSTACPKRFQFGFPGLDAISGLFLLVL